MITTSHIEQLFDDLWPLMPYASKHKLNCLNQIVAIQNYFNKSSSNHDTLLNNLCSLDGIGLTIASGLIWSVFPENRVPFDKYTLAYALKKEIIRTEKISKYYTQYSEKITAYCDTFSTSDEKYTIEDFVRDAMIEMEGSEYSIEPT